MIASLIRSLPKNIICPFLFYRMLQEVASLYGALNNFLVIKLAKRYTYLINPQGKIAKIYLSVDTSKHSQEIIEDLKKLKE